MRILILGATGFIGNALFLSLIEKYEIIAGGRSPIAGFSHFVKVDFNRENDYDGILKNVDLVINAIGIIAGNFDKVQATEPLKLFQACKRNDIKIINISAIGAEKTNPKPVFLKSKKVADDFILSETNGKVIYPGIVLGERAKSSEFFKELSSLPLIPLLNDKPIPFVHITQLVGLIKDVLKNYETYPAQIFAVAQPEEMKAIFLALKNKNAIFLKVPETLLDAVFRIFPKFDFGVFNKNMFLLFKTTRAADYQPRFEKASSLLAGNHIKPSRHLLKFLVLASLIFIWLWSGVISLISWHKSLELLTEIGITDYGSYFVIAGSVVDILLGLGLFFKKYRKSILILQAIAIIGYTLIISIFAPFHWLYPFAPIAKNIPLLALIFLTYKWEKSSRA